MVEMAHNRAFSLPGLVDDRHPASCCALSIRCPLEEQIAILTDLATVSADAQEAWLRHETLADLLDRRGEQALAAEHRKEAEDIRAAAPRPW